MRVSSILTAKLFPTVVIAAGVLAGVAGCGGFAGQVTAALLGAHAANVFGPQVSNATPPALRPADPTQAKLDAIIANQKAGGVTESKVFQAAEKSEKIAGTAATAAGVVAAIPTPATPYAQVVEQVLAEYNASLKERLAAIEAQQVQANQGLADAPKKIDVWYAIAGSVLAAAGLIIRHRSATAQQLAAAKTTGATA
jgi:hypothetical protein